MTHTLGQTGAVVERADRYAGAKEVRHLHRNVESRRGPMEAQSQIRAADDARIVLGLEPSCTQLDASRGQTGKAPLEFGAARAVAGDQHDQVRKAAPGRCGFPSANALFEPRNSVDDEIEILVFGPARRTHDETDDAGMHAEPGEERLAEPLALGSLDRHESRGGTIVKHT